MMLKNVYSIFKKHPEGQWIMEYPNTEVLYTFIKEHPIKKILDLGTGIGASAAVCALALKEKGETEGHIDTVDQFDKCLTLAKQLIPQELQEYITFHKSGVKVVQYEKIPYQYFTLYETLPEGDYDLIINDGPSPFLENGAFIELPNSTITTMLLENRLKPGAFIVWDGRIPALKTLERYFSDNFWLKRPAVRGKDDFNVLERKDTPPIFRDDKLDLMNMSPYFKNHEKASISSNSPTAFGAATTPAQGIKETL